MEYFAGKLTNYIIKKKIITEDSYEVYKYGFQAAIEMLLYLFASIIIALYFRMIAESVIFLAVFWLIRSFAGGYHCESYVHCFLCSCFVLIGTLFVVKTLYIPINASLVIIISGVLFIQVFGPIENANHMVGDIEKLHFQKKLRRNLLIIVCISIFLSISKSQKMVSIIAISYIDIIVSMILGKIKYIYKDKNYLVKN